MLETSFFLSIPLNLSLGINNKPSGLPILKLHKKLQHAYLLPPFITSDTADVGVKAANTERYL
jgi:hypothetical protein